MPDYSTSARWVRLLNWLSRYLLNFKIACHEFLGRPTRAKSFEHREQAVGNAVLAHNLWVLARLPQAEQQQPKAATRPPPASPCAQRPAA